MLNLSDRPGGYTQLTGHNQFIQASIPGNKNVSGRSAANFQIDFGFKFK